VFLISELLATLEIIRSLSNQELLREIMLLNQHDYNQDHGRDNFLKGRVVEILSETLKV
jgi:hypothetical protein